MALTPKQYGVEAFARTNEIRTIVNSKAVNDASDEVDDADWISQWSHEEELLSESTHLHAPWEPRFSGSMVFLMLMVVSGAIAYKASEVNGRCSVLPTSVSKTHCC